VSKKVKELLRENGLAIVSWVHGVPIVDKREGLRGVSGILVYHLENDVKPVGHLEIRFLVNSKSQGMILYARDTKSDEVVFSALPPGHETMRPEPAAYAKKLYEGLEAPETDMPY
jgi:hypothetical protein